MLTSYTKAQVVQMKNNARNKALIGVICAVILFIFPNILTSSILWFLGAISVIIGSINFLLIIRKPKELLRFTSFIMPLIFISLGIYVILNPQNTLASIAFVIGAGTILKGIFTVIFPGHSKDKNAIRISGIFSILMGSIIIFFSDQTGSILSYVIGIAVLFLSLTQFIVMFNFMKLIKSAGKDDDATIIF